MTRSRLAWGLWGLALMTVLGGCATEPDGLAPGRCRCKSDCPAPQQCLMEGQPIQPACLPLPDKAGECGTPTTAP